MPIVGQADGYRVMIEKKGGNSKLVIERQYTIGIDFFFRSKILNQESELGGETITITACTPLMRDDDGLKTFEWSVYFNGYPPSFGVTLSEAFQEISEGKGAVIHPPFSEISARVKEYCGIGCASVYEGYERQRKIEQLISEVVTDPKLTYQEKIFKFHDKVFCHEIQESQEIRDTLEEILHQPQG